MVFRDQFNTRVGLIEHQRWFSLKKSQDKRFDWYCDLENDDLNSLSAVLQAYIEEHRSSRGVTPATREIRRQSELAVCRRILSALYQDVFCSYPPVSSGVSIPLGKSAYSVSSLSPNKVPFSSTYTRNAYGALKEFEWISETKGSEYFGYTRIYASPRLIDKFNNINRLWIPQLAKDLDDLILLRDKDSKGHKRDLPLPNDPDIREMKRNLNIYNTFIGKQCVTLDLNDEQLDEVIVALSNPKNQNPRIHLSRMQLRRIFSKGSMNLGGRFYGGWWQQIPSAYRPHIAINGKPTVEIDYSAMAIRVLYAKKGAAYPSDQDPYDLGLPQWQGPQDLRRREIKTFVNALLNDEKKTYRLSTEAENILGLNHDQLLEAFSSKHPLLADLIGTKAGLEAMYIDSQIAEIVMLEGVKQGILILPIHDSFIIRAKYEQGLKRLMQMAFNVVTGANTHLSATTFRFEYEFGLTAAEAVSKAPLHGVWNVADLKDQYLSSRSKPSFMRRYLSSYWRYKDSTR